LGESGDVPSACRGIDGGVDASGIDQWVPWGEVLAHRVLIIDDPPTAIEQKAWQRALKGANEPNDPTRYG